MNIELEKTTQVSDLIKKAKNVAVVPSKVGGVDAFSGGLGIYFMLKGLGKSVSLVYQGKKPEEFDDLISDKEITTNVSERELIISVDYSDTEASKVHYSTENDILYLSFSPVKKNFDLEKVRAKIKGYDFDLIITIGAQDPSDLGQVFSELEGEFGNSTIINIDNTPGNQKFGKLNIVDVSESSLSLLVLNSSLKWGLKLDSNSAKALLKGIVNRKGI